MAQVKLQKMLQREPDDVAALSAAVIRAFPRALDRAAIKQSQVERLLRKVIETRGSGADLREISQLAPFGEEVDLNKVSTAELVQAKKEMDVLFMANMLKPGDPGYVYDVRKDFGVPTDSNGWDTTDDEDEYGSDFEEE